MHDQGDVSQLLRQVPLIVSPTVHIPSAVTLPYSYQPLPLALPSSSTGPPRSSSTQESSGYITSPSGQTTTTPEAISQTCHSLLQHLQSQKAEAEKIMVEWDRSITERELAEKRRIAPGYLDTGIILLEPTRKQEESGDDARPVSLREARSPGEELDKVFGS
ncbi:hypothetical protein EX30DRAFT_338978 [Ascodesmis nigricans]|uniref:Uncharacterized protein n=1 Tax=Ascodesmis nigricans TaxID=341454 RepID=A0A4S2N0V6_9PEZI|nr:hypothetical protein EX30DRAFT_338978 [Ascodesmis nigricans]